MAEPIPCPYCGSANDPSASNCHVCQYRLAAMTSPSADRKCPRCGSQVPGQFDFCPVCGLDQRVRLPRPSTQAMDVHDTYTGSDATGRPSQQATAPPDGSHMAPAPARPGPPAAAPGTAPPQFAPTMQSTQAPPHAMPRPAPMAQPTQPPHPHPHPHLQPTPAPQVTAPSPVQPGPTYGQPQGYGQGHSPPHPSAGGQSPGYPPSPPGYPPPAQPGAYPPAQPGGYPQAQAAHPAQGSPGGYPQAQQPAPGGYSPAPAPAPGYPGSGPMPGAGALRLVLVGRDGSEGQSFPMAGSALHIGRTQGEIRFAQDQFVSPLHARLIPVSGGVQVVDLGSRNGVFVRIAAAEPVYPGDLFLLGHQLLRLENLPARVDESATDQNGVRGFGTPLEPAWGRISLVGVGDAVADSYCLRGTQVVFGRESGDVLFPHDAFLSRQHARIRMELRDGSMSVMLEDLRSANGTYLRMRGQAVLHPGDMFRVGDQILRVRND